MYMQYHMILHAACHQPHNYGHSVCLGFVPLHIAVDISVADGETMQVLSKGETMQVISKGEMMQVICSAAHGSKRPKTT